MLGGELVLLVGDCVGSEELLAAEKHAEDGELEAAEVVLVMLAGRAGPEGLLVVVVEKHEVSAGVLDPQEEVGELAIELDVFAGAGVGALLLEHVAGGGGAGCGVVEVRHLVEHVAGLDLQHLVGDQAGAAGAAEVFLCSEVHDEHAQEPGLPDAHDVVDLQVEAVDGGVEDQRLAVVCDADVVRQGGLCGAVAGVVAGHAGDQLREALRRRVVDAVAVADRGEVVAVEQPRVGRLQHGWVGRCSVWLGVSGPRAHSVRSRGRDVCVSTPLSVAAPAPMAIAPARFPIRTLASSLASGCCRGLRS